MNIKGIFVAAAMAGALFAGAPVAAAQSQQQNVKNAVAAFIASNFKLAYDNAVADLHATGLDVDTVGLKALIAAEFFKPYDAAAHQNAVDTIEKAVDSISRAASDSLLAKAAAAPGAVTLPSGVIVETILQGNGPTVAPDDIVTMRYTGRLPDGSVFDSIMPDDEPMRTSASNLVAGMTQGLALMQAGGEYRLTLPPSAAYGEQGVPGVIPPNCALQFDISLLNIHKDSTNTK